MIVIALPLYQLISNAQLHLVISLPWCSYPPMAQDPSETGSHIATVPGTNETFSAPALVKGLVCSMSSLGPLML